MNKVSPKKHLGQHFLVDQNIATKIVEQLTLPQGVNRVLEIGPGMGVLTQYLVRNKNYQTTVLDIDTESIVYLREHFPELEGRILEADFLKADLEQLFPGKFAIIGNFPYNISSQIFFKVLAHRQQVMEVVCMIQKEVAERIAAPPGSKTYGILSVLLQAFYTIDYKFTVSEHVFHPKPKVKSAVISLVRNDVDALPCNEKLFFGIVKLAFQTRRKTLRNSLKTYQLPPELSQQEVFNKRAEQLSVQDFISLTQLIERIEK
ncbi:MAG: 16S rRNA (adenine(1518)-N(6)/adenine(1519)-N(6))-dimethyltransferase RsmA [Hymenobacteraceae bacterium]|nr:16S rRNA (adenine(1518)-N(6)/adenine(1519)-N(6))-dimethyltransferase RsmA [Hymenobacteraceae bacterium]MDX5395371.1 16S rRNA (adenine(1518)-N(6)/adenine(1519)-N(6))-dimethyltransferase RsmA [Hymenobacteraceae bacterium]MDX5443642.1 16S rRNA (adenine(1518)-N(6)/adenine(1519)-N(6))-dimethyltransferase RsmA [Hymenobacteraceae bacterium]MDX5511422.1 16S rRNA (adenine(1518)-N(6)/adenine(1519)-N(6))-dimethyltransferase RsmA [Hymenobacteraceae bacterium]